MSDGQPSGQVRFETASGSTYEIDFVARRWRRLGHAAESRFVRTREGELSGVSQVELGRSVNIFGPPLEAGDVRVITTTPVTRIIASQAEVDEAA